MVKSDTSECEFLFRLCHQLPKEMKDMAGNLTPVETAFPVATPVIVRVRRGSWKPYYQNQFWVAVRNSVF